MLFYFQRNKGKEFRYQRFDYWSQFWLYKTMDQNYEVMQNRII
jgi:hypothetical protein